MGFYDRYILPHLINCACSNKAVCEQRAKVVPRATGEVLEIGMGSALNLPFYDSQAIDFVWGLEPSEGMRAKASDKIRSAAFEVRWLDASAEAIPLKDSTVDTVVLTYTLCTIPSPGSALAEMRRVLKPDGVLLFAEHGLAPEESVARWQRRIEPLWGRIAGGCHLSRPITQLIEGAGFFVQEQESKYLPGPKWATFNVWGSAVVNDHPPRVTA